MESRRKTLGRNLLWLVNGYSTWSWLRCYANVNLTGTVWLRAQLDGTPVTRRYHEICWHLLVEKWHMGQFISDDRHFTLGSVKWNRRELYRTKEFLSSTGFNPLSTIEHTNMISKAFARMSYWKRIFRNLSNLRSQGENPEIHVFPEFPSLTELLRVSCYGFCAYR